MTQLESVRLYSYWRSSSAWRVRIALELKAIDYELVPVNLKPGADEQHGPVFRELNALAQVPVLQARWGDSALRLTQSMAILDLLETTVPSSPLYPADPRERAWALESSEIINSAMQPLQNLGTQTRVQELGGDGAELARGFVTRGLGALETLARQRGRTFCVGDASSVADVLLVPQLYASRRLGLDLSPFQKLLEIERHCAALPAFIKAHPDSQPDKPRDIAGSG
jgi:maleylpyruvate isomerase